MKYLSILILLLSGCSVVAPPYKPLMDNLQQLKNAEISPLNVGKFEDSKSVNKLTLRGSSYNSPFNKSFGQYIENALTQELKMAKIWSGVSNTIITGQLISNEIDASGFSIGDASISVKFIVSQNEKEVLNKVFTAKHEWESSFMGAIAIPNAQMNYPVVIQKVINKLFTDSDFILITKK